MWREQIRRVAKKELTLFFSSPIAYLFLGSFLAITLFVFFWGEAFFARNVADVRPMFEWMPLAAEVARWNQTRRIRIHTISIGSKSNFMERLAKDSGGVHAHVN